MMDPKYWPRDVLMNFANLSNLLHLFMVKTRKILSIMTLLKFYKQGLATHLFAIFFVNLLKKTKTKDNWKKVMI